MSSLKRAMDMEVDENPAKVQATGVVQFPYYFTFVPHFPDEEVMCKKILDVLSTLADTYADLAAATMCTYMEFAYHDGEIYVTRYLPKFEPYVFDIIPCRFAGLLERKYRIGEICALAVILQYEARLDMLEKFHERLTVRCKLLGEVADLCAQMHSAFLALGGELQKLPRDRDGDGMAVKVKMPCPRQIFHWEALEEKTLPGWVNMAKMAIMHLAFMKSILE